MTNFIMPQDGAVSQPDNYHDLDYSRMSALQSGRCQREGNYASDKADGLWEMVGSGDLSLDQAIEQLKEYCKHKDYHRIATSSGVRRLKDLAEKQGKVKAKAKEVEKRELESQSQGIVENQDIEQFRQSLEKRALAAKFDVATVLPITLAELIKNDAKVSNVAPDGFLIYLMPLTLSLLPKQSRIGTPDRAFNEPPVIFSAIVGDSGAGKSRIEKVCSGWFHKQQREAHNRYQQDMADYEERMLEIKRNKDASTPARPKPTPPTERKYLFNGATTEAVERRLSSQTRGSIWIRPELKGLICGIDQYKSNKGDGTETILEYWDGGGKAVDRVDEAKSFYVEGNLSIVGGIQGKVFQSAFTDLNDAQGLAARFLFCQIPTLPMRRVKGSLRLEPILENIWTRISKLDIDFLTLDTDADNLFTDLFSQFQELETAAQHETVKAWCRKLPGQLLRVAASIHLITWAHEGKKSFEPYLIGPRAVLAGWEWLTHCYDSFTLLQDQIRGNTLHALMTAILDLARQSTDGVSLRDIYSNHLRAQLKKASDPLGKLPADLVREICQELENNGYGYLKRVGKSDRFYAREAD